MHPLAAVSALTGRSLGISEYLANKRAQKEMRQKRINDPQGDVVTYPTGIMQMQPTNQDKGRGSIPSKTSTPSQSYSAPQQSAGPEGFIIMARVDIVIPEPTPKYTEENQRQVTQSLRTMQDKLNTSLSTRT